MAVILGSLDQAESGEEKIKKYIALAALAFTCLVTLSVPAKADTFGPWTPKTAPIGQYDSNFYVTLGAGGFLQQTPDFNFLSMPDGSALFSKAPDIVGGTGGFTLGVLLDNRRTPSWLGKKPRIEVSFGYGRGSGNGTATRVIPAVAGTDFFYISVDGTTPAIFVCGAAGIDRCTSTTRLGADYEGVSGAIRLKTDIHLARNLYLTPALGFVAGRSTATYELRNLITTTAAPGGNFSNSLDESLKTTRLGGEAAADLTWSVSRKWTVHGGASFAIFRMGTRLKAAECLDGTGFPPGICGPAFASTTFRAFDHQTGYRVGMNAGVAYDGGWFKLTLVGLARWDSDVPGVRNPSTATSIGSTAPARIVYSSQWRYGGFVAFSIPF